jgi:hypothetical protein
MIYVTYIFLTIDPGSIIKNRLSYVLYYVFIAQTFLIIGKRIKNEFFFSSRSYILFPQKKRSIILYSLMFGTIDINVILLLMSVIGSIIYFTNWDFGNYLIFLLIFFLGELTYLSFMMVMIEYIIERFGTSKNIFLLTFIPFFFFELFARMAEKYYLLDYLPVSGWIGSAVMAAQNGDFSLVLFYFCVLIMGLLLGILLLDKVYFPKKNNVY